MSAAYYRKILAKLERAARVNLKSRAPTVEEMLLAARKRKAEELLNKLRTGQATHRCAKCDGPLYIEDGTSHNCPRCGALNLLSYGPTETVSPKKIAADGKPGQKQIRRQKKNLSPNLSQSDAAAKKWLSDQEHIKFQTEQNLQKKWDTCPNCRGDGGATGQCYKCSGTGWL